VDENKRRKEAKKESGRPEVLTFLFCDQAKRELEHVPFSAIAPSAHSTLSIVDEDIKRTAFSCRRHHRVVCDFVDEQ
jgi:hypothetical protein